MSDNNETTDEQPEVLALSIYPDGRGVVQTIAINAPGRQTTIVLTLDLNDEGQHRYGLTAGYPFDGADGIDGLVAVLQQYIVMLEDPQVRTAFVEARIQPTPPEAGDDDVVGTEPTA